MRYYFSVVLALVGLGLAGRVEMSSELELGTGALALVALVMAGLIGSKADKEILHRLGWYDEAPMARRVRRHRSRRGTSPLQKYQHP